MVPLWETTVSKNTPFEKRAHPPEKNLHKTHSQTHHKYGYNPQADNPNAKKTRCSKTDSIRKVNKAPNFAQDTCHVENYDARNHR